MANDQVTLRIGGDAAGLKTSLNQSSAAVAAFGSRTTGVFSKLNAKLDNAADRALTPMTGLLLGGGIGYAVKQYGDLSEALMYYGFVAKKTPEGINLLRNSIHNLAVETGTAQVDILAGINRIAEITGDTTFAEGMASPLIKVSKASGASIDDLAVVASTMRAQWKWSEDQINSAFNTLIVQGDAGSYTLQKLAVEGKALFSSASTFGIKTEAQFRGFGAVLQILNKSIKSEAEVTTSVNALMAELIDKSKELGKKGIKIFDKKDGKNQIRDFEVILKELMDKTGGDITKLSPIFGLQSMQALKPLIAEYQNGWKDYETIRDSAIQGDTSAIDARFADAVNSFNSNLAKMKASALRFSDSNLAGPVDKLNSALSYLAEHQGIVTAAFYMMATAAAALAMVKLGRLGNDVKQFAIELKNAGKKDLTGKAILPGSGLELGAQRVFVVNWQNGTLSASTLDRPVLYGADGRPITFAMKELGDEATKTSGKFVLARGKMNTFLSTNLGFGILTSAVAWAAAQIFDALSLIEENNHARNEVLETLYKNREVNNASMEKMYGPKTASISRQIDMKDLAIDNEWRSFFGPNQETLDKLQKERTDLYSQMYQAQREDKGLTPTQKALMSQNINIYLDQKTGKAVVESAPSDGPIDFNAPEVTTKPWLRAGTYTGG